ncbi:hydrogenase 4 subunit F [Azospirillum sp. TSO35-2]|uniref:hydrogenase 4 subunit F n=1 Tax=Azospirillum sp. TSO35-2 TaxID=716796 RepID=UPI0020001AD0|nr:hydrogenase 4 subunit F [Azospirillum sp. TSO35-2]
MVPSIIPPLLLIGPLAVALFLLTLPWFRESLPDAMASDHTSVRLLERIHLGSIAYVFILSMVALAEVIAGSSLTSFGDWLFIDPLGAIFMMLIGVVGLLTGVYSIGYIRHDVEAGLLDAGKVRVYYGFFSLFLFTMLLAVTANNIIMMWAAIEATTLGSAFLVGLYGQKSSLEAAWKYVIICTVGVAFGLYGTVLVFSNAADVLADPHQAVLWTALVGHAAELDPMLVKLAFVFALIGFGTKAGIFPMHAWLPDAHSEAPSPVSGLLSGVLLKCALLIVIRFYVITVGTVGIAFPQMLLLTLGVLSVGVSSLLFFVQQDLKRKLAYSSIENVGLIVVALGIGGPLGIAAALLHSINHSFTKALFFCSSGNVLMKYGTRDLRSVKGILRVAPVTGLLMMGCALALAGFPPFNIFVSEFMVFMAGLNEGYVWVMLLCALFLCVTIAGLVKMVADSVLGKSPETMAKGDVGWRALAPLAVLFVLVLTMGFAVPTPVSNLIQQATAVVLNGDSRPVVAAPWQSIPTVGKADTASAALVGGLPQTEISK